MSSSWQSRLAAKNNIMAEKLVRNAININGVLTDTLVIRSIEDKHWDKISTELEDVDNVNMIFPKMEDIPLFRFIGPTVTTGIDSVSAFIEEEKPIVVLAPASAKIDQNSIIVRVFEYPNSSTPNSPPSSAPWILVLKVADILGTFGARSMVWQKLNLTYADTPYPEGFKTFITQIVNRRMILKW